MRREDPSCEEFFSSDQLEPFFVKNLENVQGDERDVIYISIGYGLTSERRLSSSFGPVNREGGERRLNVLITRARLAMEVFCNFTASDLNISHSSPVGVKALKSFLQYAENGHLENRFETGKDTDSPFEDQVISAIRNMGYEVEPQVGSAGFFIDIAVKDPQKPGKYILAVECDGASYHSSVSARDRDRLRQTVLEGMGWDFHRIWSTDWFRTQKKQIDILKESIEIAFEASRNSQELQPQLLSDRKEMEGELIECLEKEEDLPEPRPYILANGQLIIGNRELLDLPYSNLADVISQILKIEGPLHLNDAARRITDTMGIGRIGNRISGHIFLSANFGHQRKMFHLESEFLYKDEDKKAKIRDRSNLPGALKKIENVPPEEIQLALLETIDQAFSIPEQEAISSALGKMGFGRATQRASSILEVEIVNLMEFGKIKKDQDRLVLTTVL
jgi:very-short-patch-repair endonuclease